MEIQNLISSIENINLDTEKTLTEHIDLVKKSSNEIKNFNKSNESKFHFQAQTDQKLGEHLLKLLKRSMNYLNQIENFERQGNEEYKLTEVYYTLSCHILDTIRILSRDTDVIEAFNVSELMDLIQKTTDLKNLKEITDNEMVGGLSNSETSEPNFNKKENLSLENAEIVIKTRERYTLILTAHKSMSNLIYNAKFAQNFYAQSHLAQNILIFLKNLLSNENSSIYINKMESDILLFKLKVLFLLTVFNKEIRPVLQLDLLRNFTFMIKKLDLKNLIDCNLAVEVLKISYNLTMDIESVRTHVHDALSSIKIPEESFLKKENGFELNNKDEFIFKNLSNVLRRFLSPNSLSQIQSNSINLLTNLPSYCYDIIVPEVTKEENQLDKDYLYENKDMTAIAGILEFLSNQLNLYINSKISADILYPVLMLCSVIGKSNKTIRHYLREKILPPLQKVDLVNLPQNGKKPRNFLVKLMTDPNLQLKRLCAQFLFILCKENVGRLIKYTGYGNAAGLLAEAGLMLSSHGDRSAYSSESDNSDSEDFKKLEKDINLITGQAELDNETDLMNEKECDARDKMKKRKDIFEGMSEEQKEYEAEQLANAIDKLTRMGGVIKPATIGDDGRPIELDHVLQLQDKNNTK